MSAHDAVTEAAQLRTRWSQEELQWGIRRPYTPEDVLRLSGSVLVEHTVARLGAERLRQMLTTQPFVHTFGALNGSQAVQMVRAGLEAI